MADTPRACLISDIITKSTTNNNNNNNHISNNSNNGSHHEKSKTYSNGDFISKRSAEHGDTISRNNSKETLLRDDSITRNGSRNNSCDDILSASSHAAPRTSLQKGLSFSEDKAKKHLHGFVMVSWKVRQFSQLEKALRPGIIAFQYKNDDTLESILQSAERELDGRKVRYIAFVGHGSPGKLVICHDQVLSARGSPAEQNEIMDFFKGLVEVLMDRADSMSRLDFLACPLSANNEGLQVLRHLEEFIKVPVHSSKDLNGGDSKDGSISDVYFKAGLLRSWSGKANQSISNFEKIRTVGKGSYGAAVLYRKKDDDSLVILKEINIHDLNATERQMAKNEVKVLSMLSHPNIISYYDSFEEEGTLWIEMEYADGGTLGQYLSKLEKELDEKEILLMFQEMVSAIKYIHDHNILHRDLKTANIFLTKENKVKLGDFGIAKIMSTRQDANTVLGTPYYISPEMCEGKPYNEKSDMWALGCILYEMANLQKTFEGTNLPALVNKIMKGSFAPVKEIYSLEFRVLVRDLLSKEPNLRPSAQELSIYRIPELLQKFDAKSGKDDYDLFGGTRRSLLFYADVSSEKLFPVCGLPSKIQITEVSLGISHVVVVSMERGIFAWGDNTHGQLGHGDQLERQTPQEVVALRGKSILRASCGDNFTAFLSDNGLLLTCGQGELGCLGHGNWLDAGKPKLIDDLLTRDIVSVSCGRQHVAVASADGAAFTWGVADDGRLGLGDEETNRCTPTEVVFNEPVCVREVRCSADGTVFVMDTGVIFACGRNDCNKIRLNPRQGFLQQLKLSRASKNIESVKSPVLVKDLCKYQIAEVCFGENHTTIMTESGQVASMGSNNEGQLGCGNTKSRDVLTTVKGLEDEHVIAIACGKSFTLAGTNGNTVFFWGTKPRKRTRSYNASESSSPNQSINSGNRTIRNRKSSLGSFDDSGLEKSASMDKSGSIGSEYDNSGCKSDTEGKNGKRPDSWSKNRADSAKSLPERMSNQGSLQEDVFDEEAERLEVRRKQFLRNILRQQSEMNVGMLKMAMKEGAVDIIPRKIFEFSAISGIEGYDDCEEYPVLLQDIKCCGDHVFLQLETKAPLPKRKKRISRKESSHKAVANKQHFEDSSSSMTSHGQDDLNSSEASEMDNTGDVPSWIKDELEGGIPVDPNMDASSEDSSDAEESSALKIVPKGSIKHPQIQERIALSRRSSNQSLRRNRELRARISTGIASTQSETAIPESTIIDGVAISTSTSLTTSTAVNSSSSVSRSSSVTEIDMNSPLHVTDEAKTNSTTAGIAKNDVDPGMQALSLSKVFPRPASGPSKRDSGGKKEIGGSAAAIHSSDSGIEFTPVENFFSETESPRPKNSPEDKVPAGGKKVYAFVNERPKPTKSKKSGNGASQQRERGGEIRSRGAARGRLPGNKGRVVSDRNVVRDEEAAKLCEELKAMRQLHEQQEKVLDHVRKEALESEARLKEEIEKLQLEKAHAMDKLYRTQEEQGRQADAKIVAQQKEAEDREAELKSEVSTLRSELNKQSEKLQENYGILITVQEQLLRMQQEQFRSQQGRMESPNSPGKMPKQRSVSTPTSTSHRNSSQSNSSQENRTKSAVCAVM
ncbi:uncharacterized protein LOC135690390 isoform X1 [Rhopilema esculentum]|uniref:uncharacterized protein LOC135690390 isoform X1 n=1 Tax=Rhopilema esculentum TaxID=499914 RepID=UPI0031D1E5AA